MEWGELPFALSCNKQLATTAYSLIQSTHCTLLIIEISCFIQSYVNLMKFIFLWAVKARRSKDHKYRIFLWSSDSNAWQIYKQHYFYFINNYIWSHYPFLSWGQNLFYCFTYYYSCWFLILVIAIFHLVYWMIWF